MQTYNRNGVQIEQCSGCRGIFLDYGELEQLSRLENQWQQQAPPPPPAAGYPQQAPAWGGGGHGGGHYGHGHRKGGFSRMLFSS
jgi:Zn-finger nucleic acid-binding protein